MKIKRMITAMRLRKFWKEGKLSIRQSKDGISYVLHG